MFVKLYSKSSMLARQAEKKASDFFSRDLPKTERYIPTDPEEINRLFMMAAHTPDPMALFEIIETLTNISGLQCLYASTEQLEFLMEALNQSRNFPQKFYREEREAEDGTRRFILQQGDPLHPVGVTLTQKLLHFIDELAGDDSSSSHAVIAFLCSAESVEFIFSFWPDSAYLLRTCIKQSPDVQRIMLTKIAENPEVITEIMTCPKPLMPLVISVIFEVFNSGTETCPAMQFFVERIIEMCSDPEEFQVGMGWDGISGLGDMIANFPDTAAFVIERFESLVRAQLAFIEKYGADDTIDSAFWTLIKECATAIGEISFMQIEVMAFLALQQLARDPFQVLDAFGSVKNVAGLIHSHNTPLISAIIQIVNENERLRLRDSEHALKIICRVLACQEPSANHPLVCMLNHTSLSKWLEMEEDYDRDEALIMALMKIREVEKRFPMNIGDFWHCEAMVGFLERLMDCEYEEFSDIASILFADIEAEC